MTHAIRFHKTGGPEVLVWEEVSVGKPGPGEARIRHQAVGLNFIDVYHRIGLYPMAMPSGIGLEGAGVVERILHALSGIVSIRRIGETTGNTPDAILARAERQAVEGDLAGALSTLRALPPGAANAMAPWRARAQQRVALDQHLANIRAQALADLASAGGARP